MEKPQENGGLMGKLQEKPQENGKHTGKPQENGAFSGVSGKNHPGIHWTVASIEPFMSIILYMYYIDSNGLTELNSNGNGLIQFTP